MRRPPGATNRGVHEQPKQHDGEHHPPGLSPADLQKGGFEARVRPHREHSDQENQRLSGPAPGEMVEQVVRELAQREHEDQVEEKLEWGDLFLLGLIHLTPHACRSLSKSAD
jgi:hypothetical protein